MRADTPWTVYTPFPTVRSLIVEAENRLRHTLSVHGAVPEQGIEPLVHALLRGDSVAAVLAVFRIPVTASLELREALEIVIGDTDDDLSECRQ